MRRGKRLTSLIVVLALGGVLRADEGLTFFGWSDQHVQTSGDAKHLVPAIDAMNALPGTKYPQRHRRGDGRPDRVRPARGHTVPLSRKTVDRPAECDIRCPDPRAEAQRRATGWAALEAAVEDGGRANHADRLADPMPSVSRGMP